MNTSSSETDASWALGLIPPEVNVDLYAPEVQGNLYQYSEKWRELAPVVRMTKYNVYYVTSFALVREAFNNWQDFTSVGGIGLIDNNTLQRPQGRNVLVGANPPEHTRHRAVLTQVMMPGPLKRMQQMFAEVAEDIVSRAVARKTFDMATDVIKPFTETVLPDVVGIPQEGRHHMRLLGDMTLASVGPVTAEMTSTTQIVLQAGSMDWVQRVISREALTPGGVGADIWSAADRGEIDEEEARLLIMLFLFGGLDTTITTLSNGMKNFLDDATQWEILAGDPTLAKQAFEEMLRHSLPVQQSYRVVGRDLLLGGYRIEKGARIGLSQASANRDPAMHEDPNRFDILRKKKPHLGFSTGIHNCAGQILARMEANALLTALATKIRTLRPAGEPVKWVVAGLSSWKSLPVSVEER